MILHTVSEEYRKKGLYGIKRLIIKKFFLKKAKPIKDFKIYESFFKNKNGIEIGGLSSIFNAEVPIYKIINNLDGCNFSNQTVWEGAIKTGLNYNFFKNKKGYQYVCEASKLGDIQDEKYDFLISSHCLEHCANALKTVNEWNRVIKKNGAILLILPCKDFTFDHNRDVTKFSHLLEDFQNDVEETDLTHLPEILKLHDLSMDIPAGNNEQFEKRSQENYINRCLHHHVFDFELLEEIFKYFEIQIVNKTFVKPHHQIILGVKK